MVVRCLLIAPFPESALNEEAAKMLLEVKSLPHCAAHELAVAAQGVPKKAPLTHARVLRVGVRGVLQACKDAHWHPRSQREAGKLPGAVERNQRAGRRGGQRGCWGWWLAELGKESQARRHGQDAAAALAEAPMSTAAS